MWQTRQSFIVQLSKCWSCSVQSGVVMEKKWTPSFDQRWWQALQFSVLFINLLSILLRCNDFARIQKAIVDKMGSRLPNNDRDLLVQVWLWKCFGASSESNYQADHHWLSCKIRFSLHVIIRLRDGSLFVL